MHIIIGNYGNDSLAVLQWAIQTKLTDCYFLSVDTGWAAESWQQRVQQAEGYANQHGIKAIRLRSKVGFADLVNDRLEFPNKKFQWCAGILKGLPLNDYLDQIDPACVAKLLFGKRRAASRANQHLSEYIEQSDHYQGRSIWYPLIDYTDEQRDNLIQATPFPILRHRSLECDPCIHSNANDFQQMSQRDIDKTGALEQQIGTAMFATCPKGINQCLEQARKTGKSSQKNYNESFDMGCGSPWGCGE